MKNELEFIVYNTPDEEIRVDAAVQGETVWLTQKGMAALFGVGIPAISKHLKNIFEEGELQEEVVVSNIRPYFKKIVYVHSLGGCSPDVLCFNAAYSELSAYLFCTLYSDRFFAHTVAGAKGTKMPRGDKQQIMTYPIIVPSEDALSDFNALAFPIIEACKVLNDENKTLTKTRDALLPKLMSGEIDLSKAEV